MKEYTVKVYTDRTEWFFNGKRHREDGPATEYSNGSKFWFFNGKPHREAGPAVECANGDKFWYINDKLHREDGPAAEWVGGDKEWYINGTQLTEQEFNNRTSTCNGKIVEIDGVRYTLKVV